MNECKECLVARSNEGRRRCKTLQQLHHGVRSSKIQLVVKDLRAVAGGQVVAGATSVSWHVWLGASPPAKEQPRANTTKWPGLMVAQKTPFHENMQAVNICQRAGAAGN